jgi:hypothetical protein
LDSVGVNVCNVVVPRVETPSWDHIWNRVESCVMSRVSNNVEIRFWDSLNSPQRIPVSVLQNALKSIEEASCV